MKPDQRPDSSDIIVTSGCAPVKQRRRELAQDR